MKASTIRNIDSILTRPTPGGRTRTGPRIGSRTLPRRPGVKLDIRRGRHCTASQLLAGGFDLRNTAARLGYSGGGATTLRHYANPVSEVDRRAAVARQASKRRQARNHGVKSSPAQALGSTSCTDTAGFRR